MWSDKTSTHIPVGNCISVLVGPPTIQSLSLVPRPFLSYPAQLGRVWEPNLQYLTCMVRGCIERKAIFGFGRGLYGNP